VVDPRSGKKVRQLINDKTGNVIKTLGDTETAGEISGDAAEPTIALRKMQELVSQGITHKTAQGIAYGTIKQVVDPATGDISWFDLRNSSKIAVPADISVPTDESLLSGQGSVGEGDVVVSSQEGGVVPNREQQSQLLVSGNRLQEKFNKGVESFGAAVEKAGISEMNSLIERIDSQILIPPRKSDRFGGKATAGVEAFDDDIAGYGATSLLPTSVLSDQGKMNRQLVNTIQNITLKNRSGAAVTKPEFDRLKQELATGKITTDAQIRTALTRVRDIFKEHKKTLAAGFPQEVVSEFSARSGINFGQDEDKSGKVGEANKVGRFTVKRVK